VLKFEPFNLKCNFAGNSKDFKFIKMANKEPTFGNGKICYLEIPAADIGISASFYGDVFGWDSERDDGSIAFDDGVGEVSGTWILGRKPMRDLGIMISIMVDDAQATVNSIIGHGGNIVLEIDKDALEITTHFSDPAGNILGIYQHAMQ
jgi:predicted enzyme related to lactoylglutathione lyase